MEPLLSDFWYLGLCLEGFFFGLYSGIFVMYLQHHGSQQSDNTNKAKKVLFYALCVLYASCAAASMIDITIQVFCRQENLNLEPAMVYYYLDVFDNTVVGCCDFIAQCILVCTTGNTYHLMYSILQKIYRCWIMWGYSIRVVIVPSFLAFAFLPIWIAAGTAHGPQFLVQNEGQLFNLLIPFWMSGLNLTGLALSMTVNGLVTGLIVLRIFKVFQEAKTCTADDQILGVTGGSTLRRVIFILIESGMALFSIQLARLVVTLMFLNGEAFVAYYLIVGIHEILNGITPTIILVRVSMGLSFHDESSMVEASFESLRFARDIPNPMPDNGIIDEERTQRRHNDLSDDSDIQMVDR